MNPSHWYRKCPTCRGQFGRGAGKNRLARHSCDDPAFDEIRRLRRKVRELRGRLGLVRLVAVAAESDFMFERKRQRDILDRATNLRLRDWRLEV